MMSELIEEVIDGRKDIYGDPAETFPRVAQIWSGLLGTEIRGDQVALMLSAYKLFRASITPDYSDNIDDADGYNDIFRTVVGEDMIHARSTTDYLQQKQERSGLLCDACGHVKPAIQVRSIDGRSLICVACEANSETAPNQRHELSQVGNSDLYLCMYWACDWTGMGDRPTVEQTFRSYHDEDSTEHIAPVM